MLGSRPSVVAALAAITVGACAPRLGSRPAVRDGRLSPVTVLAVVGGDSATVPVLNGGYGSALARDPADAAAFYLLTDRGPNVDGGRPGQRLFPIPTFGPRIGRFGFDAGGFVLKDSIVLTASSTPRGWCGCPTAASGSRMSTGRTCCR